jgi:putative transcription factor
MGDWMEECEICGTRAKDIYIVDVESVELRVCTKCAKGKKIVAKAVDSQALTKKMATKRKDDEPQLVENYGTLIHNARESMKLPIKVLAEMINEKETLLLRVEQQKTLPSVALTKKLEKALSIKLAEQEKVGELGGRSGSSDGATIGEFISRK